MTIVINEMEVIAPTQEQTEQGSTTDSKKQPESRLTTRDIYWVVRWLALRRLRLKAD